MKIDIEMYGTNNGKWNKKKCVSIFNTAAMFTCAKFLHSDQIILTRDSNFTVYIG